MRKSQWEPGDMIGSGAWHNVYPKVGNLHIPYKDSGCVFHRITYRLLVYAVEPHILRLQRTHWSCFHHHSSSAFSSPIVDSCPTPPCSGSRTSTGSRTRSGSSSTAQDIVVLHSNNSLTVIDSIGRLIRNICNPFPVCHLTSGGHFLTQSFIWNECCFRWNRCAGFFTQHGAFV